MHDMAFAAATRPKPVVVLGLLLRTYSIGHEVLLQNSGNPLVCLDKSDFDALPPSEQVAALAKAALVCSRSWSQNHKPQRWLRLWAWTQRKSNYPQEIDAFLTYRAEGSTFPPPPDEEVESMLGTSKPDESSRLLGSPFLARLYNYVCALPDREIKHFGDSSFDFPIGLAAFSYFSKLEMEGSFRIENQQESQARIEMAKHTEDIKKEIAANKDKNAES